MPSLILIANAALLCITYCLLHLNNRSSAADNFYLKLESKHELWSEKGAGIPPVLVLIRKRKESGVEKVESYLLLHSIAACNCCIIHCYCDVVYFYILACYKGWRCIYCAAFFHFSFIFQCFPVYVCSLNVA